MANSEFLALIRDFLNANYLIKSVFLTESVKNALPFFVSVLQQKEKIYVILTKMLTLLACSFINSTLGALILQEA